ncbi:CpsB/CapC family capsule biosynthesis tyrosine phosphatase [Frisingicoccus sp.]|uniref:CpsB/CapC family capsule biosynthesis tyrosine phosphatase n=1 Tax=Frisingicoccus sp. TaxID=1918627 RepID=UPI00386F2E87
MDGSVKTVQKLLKRALFHFIGSNGYDTKQKIFSMQKSVLQIAKRYGKPSALRFSVINSEKVLTDTFI